MKVIKKIFAIPDAIYLAKNITNNLLNRNFSFDNVKNKIISSENVIKCTI